MWRSICVWGCMLSVTKYLSGWNVFWTTVLREKWYLFYVENIKSYIFYVPYILPIRLTLLDRSKQMSQKRHTMHTFMNLYIQQSIISLPNTHLDYWSFLFIVNMISVLSLVWNTEQHVSNAFISFSAGSSIVIYLNGRMKIWNQ
jgi:hypothetical protein